LIVRDALRSDKPAIASLLYFERYVHRHLDWRAPLDWLERKPFVLLEEDQRVEAVLACPSDPPEVAWIRLFAVANRVDLAAIWLPLWELAYQRLQEQAPQPHSAAIPLTSWFRSLIEMSGFQQTNEVVVLKWKAAKPKWMDRRSLAIKLRPMNRNDIPRVAEIDHQAFNPPWQVSLDGIVAGFNQSALAMVAEYDTTIVGYQICTAANNGGHLARLAVLPEWQHQGIGSILVMDVQQQFFEQGYDQVTVNTQADNQTSLLLYEKLGFQRTGEAYPLYEFS